MKDVSTGRKIVAGLFLFLALILLVSGLSVMLGYKGLASSSDIKDSSARTDCRSEYNARMGEVRDGRLDLIAQVVVASVKGDTAEVGRVSEQLDVLVAKIHELPRLDIAVDKGFSLNGVRYPPCPG